MAVARVGVGVATFNNHIYAVGGHDGRCYLNTVEVITDYLCKPHVTSGMNHGDRGGGGCMKGGERGLPCKRIP